MSASLIQCKSHIQVHRGVSFVAQEGKVTALVGISGSGRARY